MALLQFVSVVPGIGGNLIVVNLVFASVGPLAAATVNTLGFNQFRIDVTVNTTLMGPSTWADVSAALMADAAVAAIVTVTGDADTIQVGAGSQRLQEGYTGQTQ